MTKLHPDDIEVLRRMTGLPFSVIAEGSVSVPGPPRRRTDTEELSLVNLEGPPVS